MEDEGPVRVKSGAGACQEQIVLSGAGEPEMGPPRQYPAVPTLRPSPEGAVELEPRAKRGARGSGFQNFNRAGGRSGG